MYKITTWAYTHKVPARIVIGLLNIYLFVVAMELAGSMQKSDYIFLNPAFAKAGALISIGIIATLAAIKKVRNLSWCIGFSYALGRLQYGAAALGAFCITTLFFYYDAPMRLQMATPLHGSLVTRSQTERERPKYDQYDDKVAFYKDVEQYYKTLPAKELIKSYKIARKNHKAGEGNGEDTGIIILIIVGALAALFLLAALSCSIACGGAEGGASVLGILGTIGIVWGAVALIKGVKKRRIRKNEEAKKMAPAQT